MAEQRPKGQFFSSRSQLEVGTVISRHRPSTSTRHQAPSNLPSTPKNWESAKPLRRSPGNRALTGQKHSNYPGPSTKFRPHKPSQTSIYFKPVEEDQSEDQPDEMQFYLRSLLELCQYESEYFATWAEAANLLFRHDYNWFRLLLRVDLQYHIWVR